MATLIGNGAVALLLNKAQETGEGAAFTPLSRHVTFEILISDTATVKLQVSWDGSAWYDLTSKTASAQVSIAEWYPFIRANVTAYTSGYVVVNMAVAPAR